MSVLGYASYVNCRRTQFEIKSIGRDLKRSNAQTMLTRMRANRLLMEEECSSLSAETRNAIELLLRTL